MLGVFLSAYGMNQSYFDQFLKKWFYYDSKELETEARTRIIITASLALWLTSLLNKRLPIPRISS